ncbi:MAG: hypothetical protein JWO54_318 [Candidatus Saccharibacteria bacterium]|nr:hypothetical protein [Candidatus Saccharibacteria bacterium]MDB5180560.1 hypothetical protein [Candidatus Saccharibacteria bacterium]
MMHRTWYNKSMNNEEQPVAYDAEGRPLYAHPPTPQPTTPPVVHVTRQVSPEKAIISPQDQKRHAESVEQYPTLNLSEGEFIISAVRRHPIGLVIPLGVGTLLIGITLGILLNYDGFTQSLSLSGPLAETSSVAVPMLLFCLIVALGMFISWYVYVSNKFFLTNESVIQEVQHSLFSRQEQTVSLSNIEDASYTQVGILQQVVNYGDIRLSTEGDETTYRFSYVANPKEHVGVLNDAVEAFKNGRPVVND